MQHRFRRRPLPDRIVGDQIVVAKADADEAMVLGGVAAIVWMHADNWTTEGAIDAHLTDAYPLVPPAERMAMARDALRMLEEHGFLERRDS